MGGKGLKYELFFLGLILLAGCTQGSSDGSSASGSSCLTGDTSCAIDNPSTGELKEFSMIAKQFEFVPNSITVNEGDTVRIKVKSIDVQHGFRLPAFGVDEVLEPNKEVTVEFVVDKKGTFPFSCSVPCGSGHGAMTGEIVVE